MRAAAVALVCMAEAAARAMSAQVPARDGAFEIPEASSLSCRVLLREEPTFAPGAASGFEFAIGETSPFGVTREAMVSYDSSGGAVRVQVSYSTSVLTTSTTDIVVVGYRGGQGSGFRLHFDALTPLSDTTKSVIRPLQKDDSENAKKLAAWLWPRRCSGGKG